MGITSVTSLAGERGLARNRLPTYVAAAEPAVRSALAAGLRSRSELLVVDDPKQASVAVVAADRVEDREARVVRTLLAGSCRQVVVAAAVLDERAVLRAVDAGACVVLRRAEATPERLAALLVAAAESRGALPPALLGSLLTQVSRFHPGRRGPRGLLVNGFTEREIEVLQLVAGGCDTEEIAERLAYSERTVKNVLHGVTARFHLRNRCHAVAFAMRAGVI